MKYEVGDKVTYESAKRSAHPGPRARNIHPAVHGGNYFYTVNKFWTVNGIVDDDILKVITRTGKVHKLKIEDPRLRKATFMEKLKYSERFPSLEKI